MVARVASNCRVVVDDYSASPVLAILEFLQLYALVRRSGYLRWAAELCEYSDRWKYTPRLLDYTVFRGRGGRARVDHRHGACSGACSTNPRKQYSLDAPPTTFCCDTRGFRPTLAAVAQPKLWVDRLLSPTPWNNGTTYTMAEFTDNRLGGAYRPGRLAVDTFRSFNLDGWPSRTTARATRSRCHRWRYETTDVLAHYSTFAHAIRRHRGAATCRPSVQDFRYRSDSYRRWSWYVD